MFVGILMIAATITHAVEQKPSAPDPAAPEISTPTVEPELKLLGVVFHGSGFKQANFAELGTLDPSQYHTPYLRDFDPRK